MAQAALTEPATLDEVARRYEREGYGIVRALFSSDEIAELERESRRLVELADKIETNNLRCRWQTDVTTGACVFDAFDPVVDLSPACARIAHDSRILTLLQAVYGEPGHLFKDKLIFKPPGASGYALHHDYIAWPTFPKSFVTVLVAIDPADAASGCTEVFPGLHRQGCLTPADGNYHEIPPDVVGDTPAVKLQLAPGDVAFFSGFAPHRSGPNHSRHWRRQLYLSYNAASDGGDCRAAHYREFHDWLRDRYAEYGRTEVYFS